MANGHDGYSQSNVAAGTYSFTLLGGIYVLSYKGTGTGTVDLKLIGPDNVTAIEAPGFTQITATTGATGALYLPAGTYELVIATFTANFFAISRVPTG